MERSGILVVSASAGTGHLRAGEALRETLAERAGGERVEHVDLLARAPGWMRAAYGSGYELVATRAPRLWERIYHLTDGEEADRARWAAPARRLVFRDFRRLLLSHPWRLCLCTHFLPCQLAAGREGEGLPPFELVVTDFTPHRVWAQPGVRRIFTATPSLAAELRRRVRGAVVEPTGIPVSPAFAAAPPRAEARAMLELDPDRPLALVMGGGLGVGVEEAALAALAATPPGVQVVAVCGRNDAARGALSGLGLPGERLRVEGYVRGIERWISAADLVATKPGGLTVSEALALGRPLVLTRPIPGAEEGNARALAAEGAALAAPDAVSLRAAFARLFAGPEPLARLAANARRVGRPHAAHTVAGIVRRDHLLAAVA